MNNALTMLVHGPSKAGKSLMGVSTPTPRLLLDVEAASRFLPIRAVMWDPNKPPPEDDGTWDTAVVNVREWKDAEKSLQWLEAGKHPFRSATLDSVSELQARAIEAVAGRDQVQLQHWGSVLRMLRGFVSDLRDLTMHPQKPLEAVVVTSMTKVEQDGRSYPWLQGQMKTVIPYLLDVVAFVDVVPDRLSGVEQRILYTRKTKTYLAGERVGGRIPPVLTLPVVTGDTLEEVAAANVTFVKLLELVYAHKVGIAAPAAVDTSDSPHKYSPPPEDNNNNTKETP